MARTSLIVLALLALPAAGLVTRRGDPADAKTIEGDDCGHVKQIIGKWAKSKKVGELAGQAEAAVMGANLAAKNTGDAADSAEALGKKVGLKGKIPVGVEAAVKVANEAAKAATKAGSTLKTTSDTFGGKFDDFAKAISDDDIVKIKKETVAAIDASEAAIEAAERALKQAAGAKDKAMKNADGALQVIEGVLSDTAALSKQVGEVSQKSKHAAEDVDDLGKKAAAASKKIDTKIKGAKEQAPVWEAYKADLENRASAAADSSKAVTTAISDLDKAESKMDGAAKTLFEVKDKAQSVPAQALGQAGNIDAAEAATSATETALAALKGKVQSMMKDAGLLDDKLKETYKRLGD